MSPALYTKLEGVIIEKVKNNQDTNMICEHNCKASAIPEHLLVYLRTVSMYIA